MMLEWAFHGWDGSTAMRMLVQTGEEADVFLELCRVAEHIG